MRVAQMLLLLGVITLTVAGLVLPVLPAPISTFKATLTSLDEVPTLSTTGVGEFRARVLGPALIQFTITYKNLEGGAVTAAHLHLGRVGINGGVIAFLCGGGPGSKPCPPSGTVTGTLTPEDILGPSGQGMQEGEMGEVIRAMSRGATYVNVHTETYRAGEIRGQISQGRGE